MLEEFLLYHGEKLLFGTIGLGFLFLLLRQYLYNRSPEYVGTATVVSRRMGIAQYHGKYSSGGNYLVTFQIGNDTIELYVCRQQYPELTEGTTGTLHWQRDNLLSFEPTL